MGPQLENGYTKIADAILENMSKAKLNGTQFRILLIVWRSTYGWGKKSFALSESYLAEATGIHKQQIKRELKSMIDLGVLIETKAPTFNTPREIQFNKHYLNSLEVSKTIPVNEIDTSTGSELDTPTGSGLDTQNKHINKQSNKQIYRHFENEDLNNAFLDFVEYRKQSKNKMSELAITKAVNKINSFECTIEEKIQAINEAIIHNWTGIFEIKKNQTKERKVADF